MSTPTSTIHHIVAEGMRLHQEGDLTGAREKYSIVLKDFPQHADALHLMGLILFAEGVFDSARLHIEKAIAQRDDISIYFNNLSLVCKAQGDREGAVLAARRAVAIAPSDAGAHTTLGVALEQADEPQEAIDAYQAALRVDPTAAQATFNLATLFLRTGEFQRAEKTYASILPHPDFGISAAIGLAKTCLKKGQPNAAVDILAAFEAEYSTHRDLAITYTEVLLKARNAKQALKIASNALDAHPDDVSLRNLKGHILRDLDRPVEAIKEFETVLKTDSCHIDALVNFGLVHLGMENYEEGWAVYQNRRALPEVQRHTPKLDVPPLAKESVKDKDLIVWTEQGLGDEILQASLLPDLISTARSVSVICSPRLEGLFKKSFPGLRFIAKTNSDLAFGSDKRCCPLLDTALELRRNRESFPDHSGYLHPDPNVAHQLRERYIEACSSRMEMPYIIGLSWRSGNLEYGPENTVELVALQPIFEVAEKTTRPILFVSLQYDAGPADWGALPEHLSRLFFVDPMVDHKGDLSEVAAQVAACDLVISTSTTTVQIAGAIGKSTWHLPANGLARGWYWTFNRDKTPWYPSVRQFQRHSRSGAQDQIEDVAQALMELLDSL